MNKSKRMKISMIVLGLNFITFWIGMFTGAELNNLGIGLLTINGPLLAYILGESFRPSGFKRNHHDDMKKEDN
jgi:uncharacterized membrane protein YkgB